MTKEYSAHPDLACEQLQRAELESTTAGRSGSSHIYHRRQNSASGGGGSNASPAKSKQNTSLNTSAKETCCVDALDLSSKLPNRTNAEDDKADEAFSSNHPSSMAYTKDCVDYNPQCRTNNATTAATMPDIDEPDHVQHRFSRNPQQNSCSRDNETATMPSLSAPALMVDGCVSGLSSAFSSPSVSTMSSPLCTPTRLAPQLQHSHQHCCHKLGNNSATSHHPHQHHQQQQHHHHHHHHHHHGAPSVNATSVAAAASKGGCQKFDTRLGPSPYRQMLPIVLCILSFATVFSILIVYMDTTEIRHQQFRLNMSRDDDLYGVAQDDPTLIAFLREIHMRKYSMHVLKNKGGQEAAAAGGVSSSTGDLMNNTPGALSSVGSSSSINNFSSRTSYQNFNYSSVRRQSDLNTDIMGHYVANLMGGKMNGAAIQSLPGALGNLLTAPWLADTLNWAGVIVEPEPRRFFTLRKQNAHHAHLQIVHAFVSPQPYPKEVTIHNEESEVRINSLLDEETSWFNSRVKCFPLYTIMLACNRVDYDLLSLGVHGHELEILQTLPFNKINVDVISIHLHDDHEDVRNYVQSITKFLVGKSYKLQKKFGRNYFYQRINSTSRTRKKDILLLKTP